MLRYDVGIGDDKGMILMMMMILAMNNNDEDIGDDKRCEDGRGCFGDDYHGFGNGIGDNKGMMMMILVMIKV